MNIASSTFINTRAKIILCTVSLLLMVGISFAYALSTPAPKVADPFIKYSSSPNRTNPVNLDQSTLKDTVYIFSTPPARPNTSILGVYFFIDFNGQTTGLVKTSLSGSKAFTKDFRPPYDLADTNADGKAKPLDTKQLTDGPHLIISLTIYRDGHHDRHYAEVIVANNKTVTSDSSAHTTPTTPSTASIPPTASSPQATYPQSTQPGSNAANRAGYTLVWNDEFNSPLSSNWSYTTGGLQRDLGCYTRNNVSVSNGNVNIDTKAEPTTCDSAHGSFTTGEITSQSRVSPTQSPAGVIRIDMRAQLPRFTVGVWTGLWSRNEFSSTNSNAAAPYGEADLVEQWGDESNSGVYYATSHLRFGSTQKQTNKWISTGTALDSAMHIYSTEIDTNRNEIRYYFDNNLVFTNTSAGYDAGAWATSLRGNWNAKLTVQIAKTDAWHTTANPIGFQTTTLKVDYVRAYTKN